jgi:general L-amino acid transport system permease protein
MPLWHPKLVVEIAAMDHELRKLDTSARTPGPPPIAFYNNPKVRSAFYQAVVLLLVIGCAYAFAVNASDNLAAQGFARGFGFLGNTAGFGINQTLIPYSETDTYGRVFLVGLLNTLLVAGLGIVLATILGFIIGIARLSPNWLVARLAGGYVEAIRNLPLLFQILFWYLAVLGTLPGPRQSIGIGLKPVLTAAGNATEWLGLPGALVNMWRSIADWIGPPDLYLSNRGLTLPRPLLGDGFEWVAAAFVLALGAAVVLRIWARRRLDATGRTFPAGLTGLVLIVGLPLVVLFATGVPLSFEHPQLRGFNFVGGVRLIPELVALLVALVTYTAAFIAEVVRAGILAIPRGQSEAAQALGLKRGATLRLIIVPQALRVIVPPLTNQYLNLTKNSSLAVAIGYPDLFAVFAGTTLNQTHQAIEIIAITMAVYLAISLVTSLLMNWYNARTRLAER